MTNPYRAMCAELVELSAPADSISQLAERLQKLHALADRARALLAEPEAEGPTDQELLHLYQVATPCYSVEEYKRELDFARAVLARWGRPTPQPVAMIELITDMARHLAHMQEMLEDYEYFGPEDRRWYRESVRLRAMAAEVLA